LFGFCEVILLVTAIEVVKLLSDINI